MSRENAEKFMRKRLEKHLSFRERMIEKTQRMKVKRSEEYEVLEEVFDKPTLMTIYRLMNRGVIDRFYGAVESGKEAKVYWAISPKDEELAVKIYLTVAAEFKKGMLPYIEGDVRFKSVKRDTYSLVYAWALKEFKNLRKAYEVGVRVPKPYAIEKNVLVMEFIGEKGFKAPLLKDVVFEQPYDVYRILLDYVKVLYRKGQLVHGDISEYNVMVKGGELVLFDMSQAVPLSHPMGEELLRRDIANINRYFVKLGVKINSEDQIYKWIKENEPNL